MSRRCIVPSFTCCQHQSRHENSNTERHFNAPLILQGTRTRTRNLFPYTLPLHCLPTVSCCLATVGVTFHLYSILTQYHFLCHLHSLRWHSLHSSLITMNNLIHSVEYLNPVMQYKWYLLLASSINEYVQRTLLISSAVIECGMEGYGLNRRKRKVNRDRRQGSASNVSYKWG